MALHRRWEGRCAFCWAITLSLVIAAVWYQLDGSVRAPLLVLKRVISAVGF